MNPFEPTQEQFEQMRGFAAFIERKTKEYAINNLHNSSADEIDIRPIIGGLAIMLGMNVSYLCNNSSETRCELAVDVALENQYSISKAFAMQFLNKGETQ